MRMRVFLGITAVVMSMYPLVSVHAEPAPEDAAKYRQYLMRALSGHNGAISLTARGRAGDPANVQTHSAALVALASEVGPAFAAAGGAPVEDTEALPAIWDDPDAFAAAVDEFAATVAALDEAAAGGDMEAVDAAHREVAAACKSCHEDFRLDD